MNKLKTFIIAAAFVFSTSAGLTVFATPSVSAAPAPCTQDFLGFPAWYRGLVDSNCEVVSPDTLNTSGKTDGLSNFIWKIVLNCIDIALRLIGILSAIFIIYGGFRFMTQGDNPSGVEAAKKTILGAVIGLVISIMSIAIVNFVFRLFK